MKHALCTVAPCEVLRVSSLPAKDLVSAWLMGRTELPPRLAVYEVGDDFEPGDLVPDDAPTVWYRSVTRSRPKEA